MGAAGRGTPSRGRRGGHEIATPLRTRATCSNVAISRGSRSLHERGARSVACFSVASTGVSSSRQLLLLAFDLLLRAAEQGFRALDVGGDGIGFEHALEHLLLDDTEIGLRRRDLVLHRLVFAVGLDG